MKNYDIEQFQKDLTAFDISLTDKQIEQFLTYYEMLTEWNQTMNLTAITEFDDVMKKHFIDSLSLVKAVDLSDNLLLMDVGTGAGFPGLALKIAFPNLEVTLLDSLNKRIRFLKEVTDRLKLNGVETIHGRAEDFAVQEKYREKYDLCVSRAVANLSVLAEYCLPFVKKDGLFVPYKSEKTAEELIAAENAVSILGGQTEGQVTFYLPDSDVFRNLVKIRKVKGTPKKYPRKSGLPAKAPL